MPTNKQIADLEQTIQDKLGANRKERSILNQAAEAITSIKMQSREKTVTPAVETIPAVPAVETISAVMDGETEVTPEIPGKPGISEIPGKPAVKKTVFDVMPKDPMIPTKDMDTARMQEIFDATVSTINSV